MKNKILAIGCAVLMSLSFNAQAADYVIDTKGAHASISFKVSHLGYSFIKGRFNKFEGDFSYDPKNIASSKISVTVDTTSLDSNHAERDKHIRSGDFLNASKFSKATFKSTSIVDKGNGLLEVKGDMNLHGVTKPITIQAEFIGAGADPWGGERAGFEGSARLELADFKIPVVGSSSYVDLELHIEGIKK